MKHTNSIDKDKIEKVQQNRMAMEVGEWIARRLLKEPELIKTIPPFLYAYYKTWLSFCQSEFYSELYEKNFRKKL